jgi:Cu-Zn family superoxide dismutase
MLNALKKRHICLFFLIFLFNILFGFKIAYALTVPMYLINENGQGKAIGNIVLTKASCGVLLTPDLHDLPPGIHGFHLHEHPSCGQKGMDAGGHLDKSHTNEHNGPYVKQGHTGDLPVLIVDAQGNATLPGLASKINLSTLKGHALIIHEGGDNYSDQPEKLGGGGARIACGVIP